MGLEGGIIRLVFGGGGFFLVFFWSFMVGGRGGRAEVEKAITCLDKCLRSINSKQHVSVSHVFLCCTL